MALSAKVNGKVVIAPLCDDETWEDIRDLSRQDHEAVVLSGTGKQCYPRTSSMGLKHFVSRAGEAGGQTESATHEILKFLVAKAAVEAGCKTETEYPIGDTRFADVVSSSPSGPVAWEIELDNMRREYYETVVAENSAAGFETVFVTPHTRSLPTGVKGIYVPISKRNKPGSISDIESLGGAGMSLNGHINEPTGTVVDVVSRIATYATITEAPRDAVVAYMRPCEVCGSAITLWRKGAALFPSGDRGYINALLIDLSASSEEVCSDEAFEFLSGVAAEGKIPPPGMPTGDGPYLGCQTCGLVSGLDDSVPDDIDFGFILTDKVADEGIKRWGIAPDNASIFVTRDEIYAAYNAVRYNEDDPVRILR